MNWDKIRQSSVMLMLIIVLAKVVGILRDVVLASYFGTSDVSDAYLIASSVPTLLFYFIGHSLSTAYIPMYNKVRFENGDDAAQCFSNNLLNVALVLSTIIVTFIFMFPKVLVKLFASGFNMEAASLAARLIRISAPSIYLMSIIQIFGGYLQANKSFLAPAAISLPRNLTIVISVVLAATLGSDLLGWGLLISYVLEFAFLFPFVLKRGYQYHCILDVNDENLKKTIYVVTPILLGMCVSQINKIIDRSVASTVAVGGISALSYASIMNNAIQEVLVTGIITILFSSCAQLVAQGRHEIVLKKLSGTITTMIFLLIPASVGVIVLANPLVTVLLCRGSFNSQSIVMTTGALRCYTIGLLFLAVRDTLVKVFYAYKETKITTLMSIIAIMINIILNILLSRMIGINGLALATSVSAIFHCVALYIALRKKIGDFGTRKNILISFKCIAAAGVMGIIVYNANICLEKLVGPLLGLLFSVVLGALSYFFTAYFLRCTPIVNVVEQIKMGKAFKIT